MIDGLATLAGDAPLTEDMIMVLSPFLSLYFTVPDFVASQSRKMASATQKFLVRLAHVKNLL